MEGHTNGTSVLPRKEKAFWENIGYQVAGPCTISTPNG